MQGYLESLQEFTTYVMIYVIAYDGSKCDKRYIEQSTGYCLEISAVVSSVG